MTEYRQRIADQIRKEREKKGWRREDLAQKTGASYRQIERWETGKSRPQAANLKKLAQVFDVELTVLRPDLEAEEEELRQILLHLDQKLDLVLDALGVTPDAAVKLAEAAAQEFASPPSAAIQKLPATRKKVGGQDA